MTSGVSVVAMWCVVCVNENVCGGIYVVVVCLFDVPSRFFTHIKTSKVIAEVLQDLCLAVTDVTVGVC